MNLRQRRAARTREGRHRRHAPPPRPELPFNPDIGHDALNGLVQVRGLARLDGLDEATLLVFPLAGWLRRAMLDAMAPLIDPVPSRSR